MILSYWDREKEIVFNIPNNFDRKRKEKFTS